MGATSSLGMGQVPLGPLAAAAAAKEEVLTKARVKNIVKFMEERFRGALLSDYGSQKLVFHVESDLGGALFRRRSVGEGGEAKDGNTQDTTNPKAEAADDGEVMKDIVSTPRGCVTTTTDHGDLGDSKASDRKSGSQAKEGKEETAEDGDSKQNDAPGKDKKVMSVEAALDALSTLFGDIEDAKDELGIIDYSITQTTMDAIFLQFAEMQKREARDGGGGEARDGAGAAGHVLPAPDTS